jgi:hypothetical protein
MMDPPGARIPKFRSCRPALLLLTGLVGVAGLGGLVHGQIPHRYLLCDEGNANLHLVESEKSPPGWTVPLEGNGRDLQLIGNNRVLISTPAGGYYEIDLAKGARMKQVKTFGAVQSARRLPNGHTLLAGDNLQGNQGVTVLELDPQDRLIRKTGFPGMSAMRLLRLTPKGDFLFGSGDRVVEADATGKIIWEARIPGASVYKALRLPNGDTWVSTGYGKTLVLLNRGKSVLKTFPNSPLPAEAKANFFADFQILPNGHVVVANWQAHGPGHGDEGIQLLEFDSAGALASSFRQDPARFSSLHAVLVLDGLDPARLHDERAGLQVPAEGTALKSPGGRRSEKSGPRGEGWSARFIQGKLREFGAKWVLGRSG